MPASGRVIVVGSSNTDLVVRCAKLPLPGETVLGDDLLTFAGGKGANQAVGAARAGAKTLFIGAFGDDAFGAARLADLKREGIDTRGCVIKKGVPSGVALIGIGSAALENGKRVAKAENLIIVAAGANARLSAADVKKSMPKLTDRDVVLCSLEVPLAAVQQALDLARAAGALGVLNPAPYPPSGLPPRLLRAASMLIPNETEFDALCGSQSSAQKKLLSLMADGCAHVIVTQGARGVSYFYEFHDERERKLAVEKTHAPKVKPVDTVGAGDCFNGTLAAYLACNDCVVDDAIRFAVSAGALKVTRQGAQAGMPRRAEILKMMRRVK